MTLPGSRVISRIRDQAAIVGRELVLVSDGAGWALDEVAHAIADHLPPPQHAAVVSWAPPWTRGRTIHFVDRYRAVESAAGHLAERNRLVVNWSHGGLLATDSADLRQVAARFRDTATRFRRVQVWSSLYVPVVARLGVPPDRIVLLPLGIRAADFTPVARPRAAAKERLGLPPDAICVGSFQRDGETEPKVVKGPDILVELVARLARGSDRLIVLLTGPARGWVCRELRARGVQFRHFGVVPDAGRERYYHACDLYAITSREEGGPISLLEAMSAGVPVVSTRVGMAADLIAHRKNGALSEVGDIDALEREASRVLWEPGIATSYADAALETARAHDWRLLGPRYARELYS